MILGIFIIILTALLNAVLVLLPMAAVQLLATAIAAFLTHLKIRDDHLHYKVQMLLIPVGVYFAATLQVKLWALQCGEEPWRWICAAGTYLLGAFVLLLWQVPTTQSPLERAWAANRFTLGSLVLLATLGASFRLPPVHEVIDTTPAKVLRFVIGDISKEITK